MIHFREKYELDTMGDIIKKESLSAAEELPSVIDEEEEVLTNDHEKSSLADDEDFIDISKGRVGLVNFQYAYYLFVCFFVCCTLPSSSSSSFSLLKDLEWVGDIFGQ